MQVLISVSLWLAYNKWIKQYLLTKYFSFISRYYLIIISYFAGKLVTFQIFSHYLNSYCKCQSLSAGINNAYLIISTQTIIDLPTLIYSLPNGFSFKVPLILWYIVINTYIASYECRIYRLAYHDYSKIFLVIIRSSFIRIKHSLKKFSN